jgi:hypothetical protein
LKQALPNSEISIEFSIIKEKEAAVISSFLGSIAADSSEDEQNESVSSPDARRYGAEENKDEDSICSPDFRSCSGESPGFLKAAHIDTFSSQNTGTSNSPEYPEE